VINIHRPTTGRDPDRTGKHQLINPAVSQRPLVKVKETYFYIESERTVNAVKQVSVLSVLRNFFLFPLPFSL